MCTETSFSVNMSMKYRMEEMLEDVDDIEIPKLRSEPEEEPEIRTLQPQKKQQCEAEKVFDVILPHFSISVPS